MDPHSTPPNSYSLLPVQIQLMSQPSSQEKKSYLPSLDKLELTTLQNKTYVASIQDSCQYLRILLFGIFMEAYTRKPQLLTILKKVIYGGDQLGDSQFSDTLLVKLINDVPYNAGAETERGVMKIFVDTADVEILTAFEEIFNRKQKVSERLDDCISCLEHSFRINITILEFGEAPTADVCFYRDNQTILKCSLQEDQMSTRDQSPTTPIGRAQKHKSSESIDSSSSILNHHIGKAATPVVKHPHGHVSFRLNSEIAQTSESPKLIRSSTASSSTKRRSAKATGFSLWEYLCC